MIKMSKVDCFVNAKHINNRTLITRQFASQTSKHLSVTLSIIFLYIHLMYIYQRVCSCTFSTSYNDLDLCLIIKKTLVLGPTLPSPPLSLFFGHKKTLFISINGAHLSNGLNFIHLISEMIYPGRSPLMISLL